MIPDEVLKEFNSANVLVTGGTGLIGRQVADILIGAGARVRSVSLDRTGGNEKAENIVGDLTDLSLCKKVMDGNDYVCHLAGIQGTVQTSYSGMASHFVPTLMMNTNVLEAARQKGIKKLVYTSSIGAYAEANVLKEDAYTVASDPMSFAGWAKRMAELQIHAYKVQYGIDSFATVRLSNIYGPGDNFDPRTAMVIPALMHRIWSGETPLSVWGDGKAVRDFLYSRDAAEGVLLALHHGTGGDFVNIASGRGHSIGDVVSALKTFIDFEYRFDTTKPSGAPMRIMDITKARELLGFSPSTDLVTGLKATWDWFVGHTEEYREKMNYFKDEDGRKGK
jgi:GDP-L-fucose synthase